MTAVAATPRLTARAFETHPDRERAELVRGEIRPMMSPTGGAHGRIVANLFRALDAHVEARGLGMCFTDNVGFALPPGDATVRAPDVSFVQAAKLPPAGVGQGWLAVAPDLVAEVLSPTDTYREVVERLGDYFAAGVPVVWLVDPRRRGVERRTPDGAAEWIGPEGELDGAPALPGLQLAVRALFVGVAPPAAG